VILSHAGAPLPAGGEVTWRLTDLAGNVIAEGETRIRDGIPPGPPREVAVIECPLPAVEQACELRLEARLAAGDVEVTNHWPVWCYLQPTGCPRPAEWPAGLAIYDPSHTLDDWPEPSLIVATTLAPWLIEHLRAGGRVLLLQQGDGPLPARRGPFWREAIKLFPSHPLWGVFPQRGYADLQFLGLATDVMLDAARLGEAVPGLTQIHPIMRRLDAREFHVAEYLLEAQVGEGRLLACTLRLQGGMGAQPSGLRRNVAGQYLLWAMVRHLTH
jgi:hypothetical protein